MCVADEVHVQLRGVPVHVQAGGVTLHIALQVARHAHMTWRMPGQHAIDSPQCNARRSPTWSRLSSTLHSCLLSRRAVARGEHLAAAAMSHGHLDERRQQTAEEAKTAAHHAAAGTAQTFMHMLSQFMRSTPLRGWVQVECRSHAPTACF